MLGIQPGPCSHDQGKSWNFILRPVGNHVPFTDYTPIPLGLFHLFEWFYILPSPGPSKSGIFSTCKTHFFFCHLANANTSFRSQMKCHFISMAMPGFPAKVRSYHILSHLPVFFIGGIYHNRLIDYMSICQPLYSKHWAQARYFKNMLK